MVDYIQSFKKLMPSLSGYYAEVNEYLTALSGQLELTKVYTSGAHAYAVVSGSLP